MKAFRKAHKSAVALVLCSALISAAFTPLVADARITYESAVKPDDLLESVERALKKIDPDGYSKPEETQGFAFRFSNRWLSPFTYDLYGGSISSTIPKSILRVEGDTGDVRSLARVLALEQVITDNTAHAEDEKPQALDAKYHVAAQGLNLIAPWMSLLYISWRSPRLSRGQTWFRALTFFFLDAFIIYAAGSDLFRRKYGRTCTDAATLAGTCDINNHRAEMVAGLAVTRLIGAFQGFNLVRGHNRLAELKYTFYLDY